MQKIIWLLCLCSSLTLAAQDDTGTTRTPKQQLLKADSSIVKKLVQFRDSAREQAEIRDREEANMRSILALSQDIEKRRAKEKRMAFIRIGIGVLFLVVLIVGLMRRKAKK